MKVGRVDLHEVLHFLNEVLPRIFYFEGKTSCSMKYCIFMTKRQIDY